MRLTFPRSHAFDGGRLSLEDDGTSGASCQVEFGDGTTIVGELTRAPATGYDLRTPAYRTAKGTLVTARAWHLVRRGADWRSIRAG